MKIESLILALLLSPSFVLAEEHLWAVPPVSRLQSVVPVCPADGSPTAKADLDYVIALQAHPTKEQLAHVERSVKFTVFTFAEVRGDSFTAATYPKTAAFFKKVEDMSNPSKNAIKDSVRRERPYKAHPDQVKLLVTPEAGFSYPSGHATRAWLDALVMGDLDPARRSDYLASAAQVSTDRIIGGMHYPSDTAAGRSLAEAIHADLLADPSFRSALEKLHNEEYAK